MALDLGLLVLLVLKAIAIVVLATIAITDFRTQKIRNEQVRRLLVIAAAIQFVSYINTFDLAAVGLALAASGALFVALFGFWLGGKVGAGDVKLLAIVPLLIGMSGSLPFVIAMLVFSLAIYVLARHPTLLPEKWFRSYAERIGANGRVPFGIPIAAAAIVSLLLPASALWRSAPPTGHQPSCTEFAESQAPGSVDFPEWMTSGLCDDGDA